MSKLDTKAIQQEFQEKMNYDELLNCMRCGFCLPTCPTYIESGYKETHSPRGRIALMKAVVDGIIEPDEDFARTLNLCLGCRACEPVCPSGVQYGHLLEDARAIINDNKTYSLPVRIMRKTLFEGLFPNQNRMESFSSLLRFYQKSGLKQVAHGTGIMKLFPQSLGTIDKVLPAAPTKKTIQNRPSYVPSIATKQKRVAFFKGCLMDTIFMETNDSTIRLLQLAGCDVVIPKEQICCGALHAHCGEKVKANDMAKKNIEAFEDLNVDYIISNAGGCGAALMDYAHNLHKDDVWSERAQQFTNKVKDITAILVELNFHENVPLQLPPALITYQDSCHLRNVMKTSAPPRTLLKAIAGTTYVEMENADRCCGSAGIYNIVESEESMKYLDYKMERVADTAATIIVTANPGCLLQMKLGIEREGLTKTHEAVHIVDILLQAVNYTIKKKELTTHS